MDYATEMARALKDRENIEIDESCVGTVQNTNPILIVIKYGNDEIRLDDKLIIMGESLSSIKGTITLDNIPGYGSVTTGFTLHRELKKGDKVICIPTAKGQKYFIKDKVV